MSAVLRRAGVWQESETYLRELVDFVLALQERFLAQELPEDAPYAPHVDRGAVRFRSEQQLRCAIPQRHDQLRQFWRRVTKVSRHAEIGDFELASIVHEQVRRLQIAVQDPVAV